MRLSTLSNNKVSAFDSTVSSYTDCTTMLGSSLSATHPSMLTVAQTLDPQSAAMMTPRKRRRADEQEEEEDVQVADLNPSKESKSHSGIKGDGMEVDHKLTGLKNINDLTTAELDEARLISAERLRRVLFIDVDVVPDYAPTFDPTSQPTSHNVSPAQSPQSFRRLSTSSSVPPSPTSSHSPQHSTLLGTHFKWENLSNVVPPSDTNPSLGIFPDIHRGVSPHLAHFLTPKRNPGRMPSKPQRFGEHNFTSQFDFQFADSRSVGGMVGAAFETPERQHFHPINQFKNKVVDVQVRENMVIPSFIYYTTDFLLKHASGMDGLFQRKGAPQKTNYLRNAIETRGICEAMRTVGANDCVEMGALLLEFLTKAPPLVPERLHSVVKGILSLNNASTGATRLPSAGILQPTEAIIKLLRDALLLFPIPHRHVLQWIVGFACRLARRATSKGPVAATRHLATVFGPVIGRNVSSANMATESSLKPSVEWSICLFELLVHCHGLAERDENKSQLWKINTAFYEEIQDRLTASLTPRRAAFLTPRRNALRSVRRQTLGGTSRRLTFNTSSGATKITEKIPNSKLSECCFNGQSTFHTCSSLDLENDTKMAVEYEESLPSSINFVVTNNGKSYGSPRQESLNRDRYSKRLRTH